MSNHKHAKPAVDSGDSNQKLIASLAVKAKTGDRQAFEALAAHFHKPIYRMVYYRTRSEMDAEDITQDVFIKAYRNLPKLRDTDRFRGWLYRIAVNRIRDHHRKMRLRNFFNRPIEEEDQFSYEAEDSHHPDPLDDLLRRDFWQQVDICLDKLARMEREVFLLRFLDQLGIKEIAQALKKSESTVKTHLYRALNKFKKESSLRHYLKEGLA